MSEHFKHDTSIPPQTEPEVLALIRKMQQQLAFLEKKIDILIKQSSEKSFERPFQKRSFSRPFRPGGFSHSHPRNQGERSNGPGEKDFAQSQRRPFDRPQGNETREFSRGRKAFFRRQKNRG